jgi:hypothetical protein
VLELIGAKGKPLFRLEELAQVKAKEVLLRVKVGEKTETGLVRQKTYQDWQKEMARLTSPPPGAKTAPAPKSKPGI